MAAASAMQYHPSTSTSASSMHSWTSLGSMSSTAASTSSPRSTRSNSLTSGNPAAGGTSSAGVQMHASVAGQAGVPAPTDDELKGRTYLEWIRSWDDEQVAKWLTDNRCAAHAQTFASNDIRGNVLLDVDQQALKEMGVQSVGDRIKITVAVKKLRQACTAATVTQQLASRRPLHHSGSIASLQSNASNPASPTTGAHQLAQAVVAQAQLARRVSGGKSAHRIPPPLHLPSSSVADARLPQAYQGGLSGGLTPASAAAGLAAGTSASNAATYGARTSSNAANAALLAAPSGTRPATSPRAGTYPAATSKALPPGPPGQAVRPGTAGMRLQQHLGAPTISTTAASPTSSPAQASPPYSFDPNAAGRKTGILGTWSHRKAGSMGGSISSLNGVPSPHTVHGQARPSTAAASYQQSQQSNSGSTSSPIRDTFGQSSNLASTSSPYKHSQKPSYGSQGLSPIVEASSANVSPVNGDYPLGAGIAAVKPQQATQGYTVGKGGFARPTTAGGTVSIGAASGSGQIMPLEDVLRKTVKFISDDNVSKMVNLDGAKDVHEVLVRVLRKFNKVGASGTAGPSPATRSKNEHGEAYAECDGYGIFSGNGDGTSRALTDSELWSICQSASRPERSRGLLLRRFHVTPTSPEEARAVKTRKLRNFFGEDLGRTGMSPTSPTTLLDVSIPSTAVEPSSPEPSSPSTPSDGEDQLPAVAPTPPQKLRQARNTMNRASTVSIMSGLGWGFNGSGNGTMGGTSHAQTRSPSASFLQSNHQKLRSFFGQRPPSELINTHLVEYFPNAASEKKILSKTSATTSANQCFDGTALQFGNVWCWQDQLGCKSRQSKSARSRLVAFSMSSAGSHHRDSIDVPPSPSKDLSGLTSRFSEDYDASPTRPPLGSHLSVSSAAPSISIDSDEDDNNDTRSISSGMTRRTTRKDRPSSRLSAWSHSKSNKDSDNASLLTVEEITEDLEKRRLSRASWWADNAADLAALGSDDYTDGTYSDTAPSSKLDISDDTLDGDSLQNAIIVEEDEEDEEDEDEEEDEEGEEEEDDDDEAEVTASVAEKKDAEADGGEDDDDEPDVPRTVTTKAKKSTFKWVRGALIGAGSFGQVYLGMNATNGSFMAVKQVDLPTGQSHNEERKKSMLSALEREIELLKIMEHENIVQYLDSSSDGKHLYIFLEYVPGGSVAHLLANYGAFEEPLVRTFVLQILRGLSYLHENDIIHRDIKGANILVDNRGGIKISDFGISKKVEENLLTSQSRIHRPSLQGSVFWMAPEVVKQTSYTAKADIWSLGCLIVEMFTGQHPWMELTQMQAIFKIGSSKDARPKAPENITEDAQKFLDLTFHMDHNERPTAAALMKHAFVTEDMDD